MWDVYTESKKWNGAVVIGPDGKAITVHRGDGIQTTPALPDLRVVLRGDDPITGEVTAEILADTGLRVHYRLMCRKCEKPAVVQGENLHPVLDAMALRDMTRISLAHLRATVRS